MKKVVFSQFFNLAIDAGFLCNQRMRHVDRLLQQKWRLAVKIFYFYEIQRFSRKEKATQRDETKEEHCQVSILRLDRFFVRFIWV